MIRIGILGAAGRMGQAIAAAAGSVDAIVAGGVDQGTLRGEIAGQPIGSDAAALGAAADVLVDFSAPAALDGHLRAARATGTPILVGTTGLSERHHRLIDEAAADVAVLQTGNTSLGVTLLATLVEQAAAKLGIDWDVEIVEMHHRNKVDAPSGTALLLGQAAAAGRGIDLADSGVAGRAGLMGPRAEGTIGYASLRGGSVIGDHQVVFAGNGERIELGHRAENRTIFAHGALKAATWLAGKPAGRYGMAEVLAL